VWVQLAVADVAFAGLTGAWRFGEARMLGVSRHLPERRQFDYGLDGELDSRLRSSRNKASPSDRFTRSHQLRTRKPATSS
jgi:hypothetical protein